MRPIEDNRLLAHVLPLLGLDDRYAMGHLVLGPGNGLPSRLAVNDLACGAVAAAGLAGLALRGGERVWVDPRQVSVSMRADQMLSIDGKRPRPFASLSGFFRASDGWVRTHANYPHHRARLTGALGLDSDATGELLAQRIAGLTARRVEEKVTAAGGVAVRVRSPRQWKASRAGAAIGKVPLLSCRRNAESRPLEAPIHPKVLDLTRVLAGPVATRTLGYFGADVLRVDSPQLPEIGWQHIATGAHKRSTLLDLDDSADREIFFGLLAEADVLVTGYRPGALDRYGLDPDELAESHPNLIHAQLTPWGPTGPWANRRGFDSIVQAATGIAVIESGPDEEDADHSRSAAAGSDDAHGGEGSGGSGDDTLAGRRPGALPGQILDHATGYLVAAAAFAALRFRALDGGVWRVGAHLASTAAWLLEGPPDPDPGIPVERFEDYQAVSRTAMGLVIDAKPAFRIGDLDTFTQPPRPYGGDPPHWSDVP